MKSKESQGTKHNDGHNPAAQSVATRRPKTLEARLEEIIASEKQLAQARRAVLAQQRAAARKRKEALERMLGVACLADRTNLDTFVAVSAALEKHFTGETDRAFLRSEAWL